LKGALVRGKRDLLNVVREHEFPENIDKVVAVVRKHECLENINKVVAYVVECLFFYI
jgi:hypothetical protein